LDGKGPESTQRVVEDEQGAATDNA